MKQPLISVIMSVYNEPMDWINQSVCSILNQTYRNLEFIIVIDNPERYDVINYLTDKSKLDLRIHLIENPVNLGLTKSLNAALSVARGDYLARMDADDVSEANRLEVQRAFMEEHTNVGVCYSKINIIDESGHVVVHHSERKTTYKQDYLSWGCMITHPTVFFRKSILNIRQPLYNESYRTAQDYELWTTLSLNGVAIEIVPCQLLRYRQSTQHIGFLNRETQNANAREIRHNYIVKYIRALGCSIDSEANELDVLEVLNQISLKQIEDPIPNTLNRIYFLMCYSYGQKSKMGILRYFFNKKFIFLNLPIFYSYAILCLLINIKKLPEYQY